MCHSLIECVGVDKPGGGAEEHQEVRGGDGHQDRVGGGQHLGSEINKCYTLFKTMIQIKGVRENVFSLFTNKMYVKRIFYQLNIVHHSRNVSIA